MDKNYIEIKDIKQKQMLLEVILEKFHEICEENNLVYNIFGGTLLGAVRHGGFIPWDDDVDVTMPRDDYNKFIDIMKRNGNDELDLFVLPKKNFIYPYAKLCLKGTELYELVVKPKYNKLGLNIDIFPNDGYPDDESVFDTYNLCEKKIISKTYKLRIPRNPIRLFKFILNKLIVDFRGIGFYLKKQNAIFEKKTIKDSEYIICQGAGTGSKGKLKKEIYFERVLYNFDNIKVWGIKDYDGHLTNLYGNYMIPPPITEQVCPHSNKVYITKDIYDKYLGSK